MLQRTSPLPNGDYWIDVIGEVNQSFFSAWAFENAAKVDVLATEHFDAVGFPDCSEWDFTVNSLCAPSRTWAKFRVKEPVEWFAKVLGFPNVIAQGETIESSTDTFEPPDFGNNCDIGCQAERVAVAAGVILGGTALVILLIKVT